MKIEEYGVGNEKTIVMLHGALFVHSFGRQYPLAKEYHILVPHIRGFGDNTENVFQTDACIQELYEWIKSLNKKVMLVGFSLGAQLAFRLVSEHEELFDAAILVSPWLIKDEESLAFVLEANAKQVRSLRNKFKCGLIGLMNGLPPKACKEFVAQMQNLKEETVHGFVYNGITIDAVPAFEDVSIPILALAGEKEEAVVQDSVRRLSQINQNCKFEIWEKAGHNIPPLFAKRFNALIRATY